MAILVWSHDGRGNDLDWDVHEQRPPVGGVGVVEEWRAGVTFSDDEAIPTRVYGRVDCDDHVEFITLELTTVAPYGPPSRRRWRAVFKGGADDKLQGAGIA